MWAPVVVMLYALGGPSADVVGDEIYRTKEACQTAMAKMVPATLEPEDKTSFEQGYQQYMCVRISGSEMFQRAQ